MKIPNFDDMTCRVILGAVVIVAVTLAPILVPLYAVGWIGEQIYDWLSEED